MARSCWPGPGGPVPVARYRWPGRGPVPVARPNPGGPRPFLPWPGGPVPVPAVCPAHGLVLVAGGPVPVPVPAPIPVPVPVLVPSRPPGPSQLQCLQAWMRNLFRCSTLFSKSLVRGKQYCEVGTIIEQKQAPNGCQSQLLDMKTLDVASLAAVFLERLCSRCCLPGVCFLEPL